MASLTYNGKLIIASAEPNPDLQSWKIHLVISWHLITREEFATKEQAEQAGLEMAKRFINQTTSLSPS